MKPSEWLLGAFLLTAMFLMGCKSRTESNVRSTTPDGSASPTTVSDSTYTGVEKVKPAPGTGNVQGKVQYNGKPVPNIEVKLCETFNRFFGGCSGKTLVAQTDQNGEYVIANVEPKVYEGLLARVFDTDSYVFATTGIAGLSTAKYEVIADKTLFVPATNLFKGDLKLLNPKAGAKVSAQNLELKWDPYPDAAYYKFSVHAEDSTVTSPYINERVEATAFGIDKALAKGTYRWQVEAYNPADQKLSESSNDIKFTITDSAAP